jgi:hypothetical protein
MVNVVGPRCPCGTRPTFGVAGDKKPTACSKCMVSGMVDIRTKKCRCGERQPTFGLVGDKPTHCMACKELGMINVKAKRCPCGTVPVFGFDGDKTPTCCASCKKEGMTDIMSNMCQCKKNATFGLEGDTRASCCASCKQDGMIDMKSNRCECGVVPCFGFEGDRRAICCKQCKKEGMIDIKNNRCPCLKQPAFGFEGGNTPTCCYDCKQPGMIDIRSRKCACGKVCNFGFEGDKVPLHCAVCKELEMVDIRCPKCESEWCDSYARYKHDGRHYCLECILRVDPMSDKLTTYVRKEIYVLAELQRRVPELFDSKITWDCPISGGCSKRRPDLCCDWGEYVLIVELDEFGHEHYCAKGEMKRLNEIWSDLDCRPMGVVRLNPDEYVDSGGETVKGMFRCYRLNTGERRLKGRGGEFEKRMNLLEATVRRFIEEKNEEIEYLYYTNSEGMNGDYTLANEDE